MRTPQLMKEYQQLVELCGTAHLSVKKHLARSGLGGSFALKASWDQGFVAVHIWTSTTCCHHNAARECSTAT